ncbi:uncharacterized protein RCC_05593 [Ramularia collo-cygni]|uniref:Uncharacterized protein n=1 Tax=Ramularia collo-cygni TaxID=112498 RepID=A0A2D3UWI3_9PEZI|nr:uncharacterized protein RCC_05593 [Ramularia collo-cygni]CZT19738.1 uncharacterized protein RCC_05593 [Ramularia collo-cygni]
MLRVRSSPPPSTNTHVRATVIEGIEKCPMPVKVSTELLSTSKLAIIDYEGGARIPVIQHSSQWIAIVIERWCSRKHSHHDREFLDATPPSSGGDLSSLVIPQSGREHERERHSVLDAEANHRPCA